MHAVRVDRHPGRPCRSRRRPAPTARRTSSGRLLTHCRPTSCLRRGNGSARLALHLRED
jgi:hypothetical protein